MQADTGEHQPSGTKRASHGFSLIELLIVVTIILIIAAIAIPSFLRSRMRANESAAVANMRNITTAEVVYATFGENARVTAATIDAGDATFIGDYNGVAAAAGSAHPVWTNGGFNNGSMQTARVTLP